MKPFLITITCCISFFGLTQSEYRPIKFIKDYTNSEEPVIDSILINGDLSGYIKENCPALVGERVIIRAVLIECDNNEYFRVYDCIALHNDGLKMELAHLSDWISEKKILIFFNPDVVKTSLEKKTTKCSFAIEW